MVRGDFQIQDATGRPIEASGDRILLCRCGDSENKPLCDGSHKQALARRAQADSPAASAAPPAPATAAAPSTTPAPSTAPAPSTTAAPAAPAPAATAAPSEASGPNRAPALRPRFEGANIRTWIGFKHFMYLAEEAVLDWFRDHGYGPAVLFHRHGLALSIVDASVQLPAVVELDDVVDAEVTGGPTRFAVKLKARRPGGSTVLRGRITVALRRVGTAPDEPVPAELVPAVAELGTLPVPGRDSLLDGADPAVLWDDPAASAWSWRVPYYYCQFSGQIQHSGYVRAVEEAVDRFLAERGISVGTMLDRRGWIPVVSRARVTQFAPVGMEETVHTRMRVVDIVRDSGFDAVVAFYADRDGAAVPVGAARILHGYAISRGPDAGRLARLDTETVAALTGQSLAGAVP